MADSRRHRTLDEVVEIIRSRSIRQSPTAAVCYGKAAFTISQHQEFPSMAYFNCMATSV